MKIKYYKPYTPSVRHKTSINFFTLSKKSPEKSLFLKNNRAKGRNNQGKITIRHRGGGHKKLYRSISLKKTKFNLVGRILSIEYDPNRSSYISLVYYENHTLEYMLHVEDLKIGSYIYATKLDPTKTNISLPAFSIGNTMCLKYMPLGTKIHNLEFFPGKGGQLLRSAGCFGKILAKEKDYVAVRLPSQEIRLFHQNCLATIGKISNSLYYTVKLGKAGRKRWLGIRPTVRGSAMNPIDHPHGGGEGRCPIGKPSPLTPWGKKALGVKTRNKKKNNNLIIKRKDK
jgi:large subunit ribosomal protein L2|uniref:Large ribosomal subunit protein uL2m n=1 Tax=Poterioochromonas malhamensis TaxID=88167 RepID=A0A7T6Y7S9_9STRA|nr:ribosomal protein L2 [Poterioochromonas malhamensis]QQK55000.1 ribosomal protein L2 [Poterioochromonas malhamensis]